MSRLSLRVRDAQRRAVVARYSVRRAELKATIAAPETPGPERAAAVRALARQPRDASPVRVRNRDAIDGRPRGFLRAVGVSRIRFRELAHRGELPGITTSSW